VMFKDTMVTAHICDFNKNVGHRYQPYSRSGRPIVIKAHLSSILGDCPKDPELCLLRSSPTPTEVNDCQTQHDQDGNTSCDDTDEQSQASQSRIPTEKESTTPIPSSDFDMPSLLELCQTKRVV
jgi:hypothetical protein